MRKTTDNTMEEDIGEISLGIRETVTEDQEAPASMIDRDKMTEQVEKAAGSLPRRIVERWIDGESPRQIAEETGEAIETIYEKLREIEKAIIEGSRIERHGKNKL